MEFTNQIIFFAGLLVLFSVIAGAITPRIGMPLLLVFLLIGMLAGEDGPGGLVFDDVGLAFLAASFALAVILFDGGLRTQLKLFRVGLKPALSLASFGVLVTAALTGIACIWVFNLGWMEALLLGAIVASTDAAAVFALLTGRSRGLSERVSATLEIESGTNDPMAIFLVVVLVDLVAMDATGPGPEVVGQFLWQIGGGAAVGIAGGFALVFLINRLTLSASLYPLLALSGGAVIFGLTQMAGASGFLAAYLAGLVVGNRRTQALHNIQRFYDGVAWLAQIGLFLILGLLATPRELVTTALPALLIAATLIFVARPVAVFLSLAPFRFHLREKTFISWVGLRGAVPIVLAMFPLIAGLENAQLYFNVAFFIVLVSLVLQGWTVPLAARLMRVDLPTGATRVQRVELVLPGQLEYEIVGYRIDADSPAAGRMANDLESSLDARVTLVVRDQKLYEPDEAGVLLPGDYAYLLVRQDEVEALDLNFVVRAAPQDSGARTFFGEFVLEPSVTLGDLVRTYGIAIEGDDPGLSLGDFLQRRFPTPVVGDRTQLGPVKLVVREMDGGIISKVGLKLGG